MLNPIKSSTRNHDRINYLNHLHSNRTSKTVNNRIFSKSYTIKILRIQMNKTDHEKYTQSKNDSLYSIKL